ncbi:MAG TPA: DNA polymerase IV, partial [Thermoanaerobaculia bacterium]|nr:DNA polymerase IV [Thermoanaerobaculia bacterium]
PIWALLDLDAFYVSVERAKDPSLVGKPVIVGGDPERGRGIVASASYEARARGVRTAMPAASAARLCPDAIFLRPDFAACTDYSRRAAAILDAEAPRVLPASIDEFYLDFTHRGGFDFEKACDAVARLRDRLRRELALPSSAGIATSRLVAKIACGKAKPDRQIFVPPGSEAVFLAPLPVGEMPGIGPKTEPRFLDAGFRTIGDLANRPEGERRELLGEHAEYWKRRAQGQDVAGDPFGEERDRSIGAEETFDRDLSDPAEVDRALASLAETACFRLRRKAWVAATLSLKIRYEDFETISASHTFPEPTDGYDEIRKAAAAALDRRWNRRRRLRLLGVRLTGLEEKNAGWLPLELPGRDREERAFAAVDRIKEKFGEGSLRFARGTRLPDK